MEAKASRIEVLQGVDGLKLLMTIEGKVRPEVLERIANGRRPWRVTIKVWRDKRSLDANAYIWLLLGKMAVVLRTDKDELYLDMLRRYGRFVMLTIFDPAAVDVMSRTYRLCRSMGEVKVGGKIGIQLQCYIGSSRYDTKEMSVLIDGVVSECQELGIETRTPEELAKMKAEWGNG